MICWQRFTIEYWIDIASQGWYFMFKIKSLFDMIFTQSIRICQCTENKIIWNRNNHHKVFFTNVTLHISTPSLVFTNWYWRLKKIHCWLFWASRNVQCIVTNVQLWWKLQRPPRLWVLFPESLNLGYCSLLKKNHKWTEMNYIWHRYSVILF